MTIRMPIKFHATYQVTIRSQGTERKERCQKLDIRELSEQEKAQARDRMPDGEAPTHQITFYDFGCKRMIDGRLAENEEDRVVFLVEGKEFELSLFRPAPRS